MKYWVEKSLMGRGAYPQQIGCEHHACPILMITTERGYHARCPNCQTTRPERPSSKATRQALLILARDR